METDPCLSDMIEPLLGLCRGAARLIRQHYEAPGADAFEAKADDSPLTQADLASDRHLQTGLAALTPDLPVLSEESAEEVGQRRRDWQRYWIVDPLDGTKEFLGRTGEFTINIGLIDNHRPVLGLLYLPLDDSAFVGVPGQLSRRFQLTKSGAWRSQVMATRALERDRPLVLLASRRHRSDKLSRCEQWLTHNIGPVERRNSGSAIKFCQLAGGEGDVYPRFSPCCEWDTAAGQAVLEAAGGALLDLRGNPLRYNVSESLYSPDFFALADPARTVWQELFEASSQW
ncbi:MAG: 3'(2'),5'-bisphosphate nucleotidase CysQ [Pseudomonadota bacterium]